MKDYRGRKSVGRKIRRIPKNRTSLALVLFTEMKYGGLRGKFLSFDASAPPLPGALAQDFAPRACRKVPRACPWGSAL